MTISVDYVNNSLVGLPTTEHPVDILAVDSQLNVEPVEYAVVRCSALEEQLVRSLRNPIPNKPD